MLRTAGLLFASALLLAAPALRGEGERVELDLVSDFGSDEDGRREGWLRYARARSDGPIGRDAVTGSVDPPTFEEEVYARRMLAESWAELAARRGYRDDYLEALGRIARKDYLREYTWACLHVLRGLEPKGLDQDGFRRWFARSLPEHEVETWVTVRREDGVLRLRVGKPAHAPYRCAGEAPERPRARSSQRK